MNKYNHFFYHKGITYRMRKHTPKDYNQRTSRRYKRSFSMLTITFVTKGLEHHSDNSYYYFDDQYKGRRYQFIHGAGVLELRTDTYVKRFDDDPILGWWNR